MDILYICNRFIIYSYATFYKKQMYSKFAIYVKRIFIMVVKNVSIRID